MMRTINIAPWEVSFQESHLSCCHLEPVSWGERNALGKSKVHTDDDGDDDDDENALSTGGQQAPKGF